MILGLIVGPLIGIVLGDYFLRSRSVSPVLGGAAVAILLAVILVVPLFSLELKLGLVGGILLGALLSMTPISSQREQEIV